MTPLPAHQVAKNLQESNSRLISLIDQVHPNHGRPSQAQPNQFRPNEIRPNSDESSVEAPAATPHQMSALLSELKQAAECLRSLPLERAPEVEQALNAYRVNVQRLQALLPSIHSALLRERARLEQECTRVEAAAEWASRSRQTL